MKSQTSPEFWKEYSKLDAKLKQAARKAYIIWHENPFYPSLRFKCINSMKTFGRFEFQEVIELYVWYRKIPPFRILNSAFRQKLPKNWTKNSRKRGSMPIAIITKMLTAIFFISIWTGKLTIEMTGGTRN